MVNAVEKVVESLEHDILARILNLSIEVAKSIKLIEAEQLYELDLENRSMKLSSISNNYQSNG